LQSSLYAQVHILAAVQWEAVVLGFLHRFANDETGGTALEYGLIAAGIAVVIIASSQAIGTSLSRTLATVAKTL
jgi:pilus assembly protein Flp/PilA